MVVHVPDVYGDKGLGGASSLITHSHGQVIMRLSFIVELSNRPDFPTITVNGESKR